MHYKVTKYVTENNIKNLKKLISNNHRKHTLTSNIKGQTQNQENDYDIKNERDNRCFRSMHLISMPHQSHSALVLIGKSMERLDH